MDGDKLFGIVRTGLKGSAPYYVVLARRRLYEIIDVVESGDHDEKEISEASLQSAVELLTRKDVKWVMPGIELDNGQIVFEWCNRGLMLSMRVTDTDSLEISTSNPCKEGSIPVTSVLLPDEAIAMLRGAFTGGDCD